MKKIWKASMTVIAMTVLAFCIAFSFKTDVSAASENGFYYEVSEGKATIIDYRGSETNVVIPAVLGGYPVDKIGMSAFTWDIITEITISEGITNLDLFAFSRCANLSKISISSTVTSISVNSFFRCPKLTEINVAAGSRSFSSEKGILYDKKKTSLIRYPQGKAGTSYMIPGSVTEVGDMAFDDCSVLETINVASGNTAYSSANGILFDKNKTTLVRCPQAKKVFAYKVPETVKTIYYGAFYYNGSLSSVDIPASVTYIEHLTFTGCANLKSITIRNPECEIDESEDTIYNGAVIYGYANSTAQSYANTHKRSFAALSCAHNYTSKKTDPSCSSRGYTTYTCTVCKDSYKDNYTDKTAHTPKKVTTKATASKAGKIDSTCTVCKQTLSSTAIPKIKAVTLSASAYTYNGKARKPGVTVKDSTAAKLKNGTDYSVTYASGRKNVGKYTVTVKFKGNYSGTVKKTFTIKPKETSISTLTAAKKGLKAKWKKQTAQVTGYQIRYSTNKNFKSGNKTVTISKNKTTSKSISKLKAKQKYYVQVRTYKTVKINGKNTKIYSSWSKGKAVKTK